MNILHSAGSFARRVNGIAKKAAARTRTPYRAAVCVAATAAVLTSAAMHAANAVTPDALDRAALFAVITAKSEDPSIAAIAESFAPKDHESRGLYAEELYFIADDSAAETEAPDVDDPPREDGYPITALDLSGSPNAGELLLRNNETDYDPDLCALRDADYPIARRPSPRVLILHTHATEAYSDGSGRYDDSTSFRSRDVTNNIVAVGEEIARVLRDRGVEVIHCEELHDADDFNHAYDREKESILRYLDERPDIDYILDVHRDAIVRANGEMIAPAVDTPQGRSAQIMLVVGTNAFGADHPLWEQNLNVACKLQTLLNADFNLARPINLRGASFNEQFRAGSLLVEVGSSGNTLDEAKLAGRLFASAFADLIVGG